MKKNTKFVGNRIPLNIYRKLDRHSDKTGLRKQRIMTVALEEYFSKREDTDEPPKDK